MHIRLKIKIELWVYLSNFLSLSLVTSYSLLLLCHLSWFMVFVIFIFIFIIILSVKLLLLILVSSCFFIAYYTTFFGVFQCWLWFVLTLINCSLHLRFCELGLFVLKDSALLWVYLSWFWLNLLILRLIFFLFFTWFVISTWFFVHILIIIHWYFFCTMTVIKV